MRYVDPVTNHGYPIGRDTESGEVVPGRFGHRHVRLFAVQAWREAGFHPPADPPEADARSAREYCLNIADAAADARLAWQKKTLADLEQEIAKRVELLEAKTAEYQRWLARRDEFSKKAHESVVTIYARMKPDAAAAQLVAMDEETAAAVLTKLDPRNASAILNEMAQTATPSGRWPTSWCPRD